MSTPPTPFTPRPGRDADHERDLDPAQQSLADALRVSFWVLKISMLLLIVIYLFSGVFNVREQEMAVRLRFGRIVGSPGQQVLEPGGPYFSWPFPFEQIVMIPASPQLVELNHEFWYGFEDAGLQGEAGPLDPQKDGSLLTGDAEIVHSRWAVTYVVKDPIQYLTHVKDAVSAQRLVRVVAQQAVVFTIAQITTDELIRSQNIHMAKTRAQVLLDALDCGIEITGFSVKNPAYPLSVRPAVQAVLNAENVKAGLIEEAQEQWARILVKTAGEAYLPLLERIDAYEVASQLEGVEHIAELDKQLDEIFTSLVLESEGGAMKIGGDVAEMIHDAETYRIEIIARVRSDANYFSSLLPKYRENPRIVRNRLWQDAKQRILTGDIETMYLPHGQVYLELNRDPKVQQERERKKLIDEEQARDTQQ